MYLSYVKPKEKLFLNASFVVFPDRACHSLKMVHFLVNLAVTLKCQFNYSLAIVEFSSLYLSKKMFFLSVQENSGGLITRKFLHLYLHKRRDTVDERNIPQGLNPLLSKNLCLCRLSKKILCLSLFCSIFVFRELSNICVYRKRLN